MTEFSAVPAWTPYNARTETVATKPSFRNAFKRGQFCVVPADAIFEPSYETGKAERFQIASADGAPLGIAGIWEYKAEGDNGLPLLSFSMLTINADAHPLMNRFHKPTDEKRMLVFLRPDQYDSWLHCPVEEAAEFFAPYPAEQLVAQPAPRPLKPTPEMPAAS